MANTTTLQEVDHDLTKKLEAYSEDFWTSRERDPREDAHAFFQYPAMMVPEIQTELVKTITQVQPGIQNILDCFAGAGTTMTSCMQFGLNFTGQDINPLAVLVSRAKQGPFYDHALYEKVANLFNLLDLDNQTRIEARFDGIDKWFEPAIQTELSRIHRAIRSEKSLRARRFFWVALAETVRVTSNSRTSTYKLHMRPEEEIEIRDVSAVETFKATVRQNLIDLRAFKQTLEEAEQIYHDQYSGKTRIDLKDSSQAISPPTDGSQQYDLLITSPPYGDNTSTVPYGQHSYLPLQWIDLRDIAIPATKINWLRTTLEIDKLSLGGREPQELEYAMTLLAKRSRSFRHTLKLLQNEPLDRTVRVTTFFHDLNRTLRPIVNRLKTNAYLLWIVGNRHVGGIEIPTDRILTELLEHLRVQPITRITRNILFRRMAARNQIASMMRQEHILVLRKTIR